MAKTPQQIARTKALHEESDRAASERRQRNREDRAAKRQAIIDAKLAKAKAKQLYNIAARRDAREAKWLSQQPEERERIRHERNVAIAKEVIAIDKEIEAFKVELRAAYDAELAILVEKYRKQMEALRRRGTKSALNKEAKRRVENGARIRP